MSKASSTGSLPDSLLIAIGHVATSSVKLENALRYVVGMLTGDDDAGWIIFEGQSIDWLILNGNAVLGQYVDEDKGEYRRLGSYGNHLRSLFKEAEALNRDRNIVIHGEWRRDCFLGSPGASDGCKPHSPDSITTGELFHVVRSRYRKGYTEEAWSIADMKNLAFRTDALAEKITNTYKEFENSRLSKYRQA